LPQKITIDHIDNASKAWRTIDSSNEKKYADALCNQNFSTKIDTKVYSN